MEGSLLSADPVLCERFRRGSLLPLVEYGLLALYLLSELLDRPLLLSLAVLILFTAWYIPNFGSSLGKYARYSSRNCRSRTVSSRLTPIGHARFLASSLVFLNTWSLFSCLSNLFIAAKNSGEHNAIIAAPVLHL